LIVFTQHLSGRLAAPTARTATMMNKTMKGGGAAAAATSAGITMVLGRRRRRTIIWSRRPLRQLPLMTLLSLILAYCIIIILPLRGVSAQTEIMVAPADAIVDEAAYTNSNNSSSSSIPSADPIVDEAAYTNSSSSSSSATPVPAAAASSSSSSSSSATPVPAAAASRGSSGSGSKPHFYDSCFQSLAGADAGQDAALDPTEYTNALFTYTRGVATKPLPQDLVNVFLAVADSTTMLLPVPGVRTGASADDVAFVSNFCFAINTAIQEILGVALTGDECMGSLGPADTVEPKGNLSPDEYVAFLKLFTNDPAYQAVVTLDDLNLLTRTVFTDMAIDGFINGSAGPEYLVRLVFLFFVLAVTSPSRRYLFVAVVDLFLTYQWRYLLLALLLLMLFPTGRVLFAGQDCARVGQYCQSVVSRHGGRARWWWRRRIAVHNSRQRTSIAHAADHNNIQYDRSRYCTYWQR
jgi:hypothetical protein